MKSPHLRTPKFYQLLIAAAAIQLINIVSLKAASVPHNDEVLVLINGPNKINVTYFGDKFKEHAHTFQPKLTNFHVEFKNIDGLSNFSNYYYS